MDVEDETIDPLDHSYPFHPNPDASPGPQLVTLT